jgi:hypothetical protein
VDTAPADSNNPQTINRYIYALDNPLTYTDPTGANAHGSVDEGYGQNDKTPPHAGKADPGERFKGWGTQDQFNNPNIPGIGLGGYGGFSPQTPSMRAAAAKGISIDEELTLEIDAWAAWKAAATGAESGYSGNPLAAQSDVSVTTTTTTTTSVSTTTATTITTTTTTPHKFLWMTQQAIGWGLAAAAAYGVAGVAAGVGVVAGLLGAEPVAAAAFGFAGDMVTVGSFCAGVAGVCGAIAAAMGAGLL